MPDTVRLTVEIDKTTDALVRSHLARRPPTVTFDAFVEGAIQYELRRLACIDHERTAGADRSDTSKAAVPPPNVQ